MQNIIIDSPLGDLTIVGTAVGLTGVYFDEHRHAPALSDRGERVPVPQAQHHLQEAARQLTEYFADERQVFDLPHDVAGTPFQHDVWRQLQLIPYGQTASYGEIAERLNNPNAVRAVGLANGRNPLSIIVPCHRVVGANGSLTGYGGGISRKRALLERERAVAGVTLY
ncbi:MAG: methylated-DNA--[protein]-cysteine S-methyltransferase [Mycetocola sp.]